MSFVKSNNQLIVLNTMFSSVIFFFFFHACFFFFFFFSGNGAFNTDQLRKCEAIRNIEHNICVSLRLLTYISKIERFYCKISRIEYQSTGSV